MSVDLQPVKQGDTWVLECPLCGERTSDCSTASRVSHAEEHVRRGDGGRCYTHGCLRCSAGICWDHGPCIMAERWPRTKPPPAMSRRLRALWTRLTLGGMHGIPCRVCGRSTLYWSFLCERHIAP